ncbi:MAG: hypothetical protein K9J28_09305 [Sulfuritalea sp.]|nr:hypothetical protein [Sulfuritalea sp.]
MTTVNRNDAWSEIFADYPILEKVDNAGFYDIQASDIKRYKEPRLMCKVDFREGMPDIMRQNGLSILAIQNGVYRIARNSPFLDVREDVAASIKEVAPPNLITLDHENPSSESAALDIAFATGILDDVFGEPSRLTIRGRKRCDLEFNIGQTHYPVEGVQVEVDGGYEGESGIHLIEAKIGSASNINIRQLLYPHRFWENFSESRKTVSSYIFFYQEGIYRFIPFEALGDDYRIDQSAEKLYRLKENRPTIDIRTISKRSGVVNETAPFPQADKLDKVIALVIKIAGTEQTLKEEVFLMFDMVPRQIDYYCNAALWLKLIEYNSREQSYQATSQGLAFAKLSYPNQIAEIAKLALTNSVFNFVLHNPDSNVPQAIRFQNRLNTDSTYERRLLTVRSWLADIERVLSR